jgi:hypothetical protein
MAIGQPPTVDYNIDVQTPFQAAVQGLQFAAGRETLEAARTQRDVEAQARQTALAQQQQFQTGLNSFFRKPPAERNFDELSQLMIGANKQQFDALKNIGDTMSTDRKEASQKFVAQGLLALEAKPELFQTMVTERISVETDPNQKRALETVQQIAQTDPKRAGILLEELGAATFGKNWYEGITSARAERRTEAEAPFKLSQAIAVADKAIADATTALATATNAPEKAAAESLLARAQADKASIEAKYAEQVQKDAILKRAADLGLTNAQRGSALAQTNKLGIESKKAALELEALKATGGVDPTKTFEQEEKLRKEYQNRTKVYGELRSTFANIESSAKADSGPGDIALITSFMKMLDPGSVVRETEFATARDTAGLYSRLENALQKAQNGKFLNETQRKEYVDLAKQYLEASQKKAGEEKTALGVVVKNYKLNRDNVFGPETAPPSTPSPNSVIVNGQTFNRPANFTDAQWSAYKQSVGAAP